MRTIPENKVTLFDFDPDLPVGTIVKLENREPMLIGDINTNTGACSCCAEGNEVVEWYDSTFVDQIKIAKTL